MPRIATVARQLRTHAYSFARRSSLFPGRVDTVVECKTDQKVVALTFDDGPDPVYTPQVLNVLSRYSVPATFFLLGRNIVEHPHVAREVYRRGHAVGNHTFTHPLLPRCGVLDAMRELTSCHRALRDVVGVKSRLMRPPYGEQSVAAFAVAQALGYWIVHWSVPGDDWSGESAVDIASKVRSSVRPGAIVLLHDRLERTMHAADGEAQPESIRDRTPTIDALPLIIEPLLRSGYRFLTVPDLLALDRRHGRHWSRTTRASAEPRVE